MVFPATALTDSNRHPPSTVIESLDTFIDSSLGYFPQRRKREKNALLRWRYIISTPLHSMEPAGRRLQISATKFESSLGRFCYRLLSKRSYSTASSLEDPAYRPQPRHHRLVSVGKRNAKGAWKAPSTS